MKLFGLTIQRAAPLVALVQEEQLSERQLEDILRRYPAHPLEKAFLQIVANVRETASMSAEDDKTDRDSHVGTTRACRLIRDELRNRRQAALKRVLPPFRTADIEHHTIGSE